MFHSLKDNLLNTFGKLKSKGFLTEEDIDKAMREIRITLLEADVSLIVAKEFINKVKEQAIGEKVYKSVKPGEMVIKIVHDELIDLLGSKNQELKLLPQLTTIMMVGLQGSGKTTSSAKLALYLRKHKNRKPLLASLDIYRPAAQKQLEVLAKQLGVQSLPIVEGEKPEEITKRANSYAQEHGCDLLILDTAGRLHTDSQLMAELKSVEAIAKPSEILLVVDSLTGQDAINIGREFKAQLAVSGVILTRVDGDARGGAALSMVRTTDCAIKFIGVGEKLNDFEAFHPERAADRILDKGDIISMVEHASEVISEDEASKLADKIKQGSFNMNDLLAQMKNLRKMGGMGKMLGLLPGMGKIKDQMKNASLDEDTFKQQEAIISSMTMKERLDPSIINASRRKRIAAGSGMEVSDVNQLLNRYKEMYKMLKKLKGMDLEGDPQAAAKKLPNFEKMMR